jgi:hypothetical protein
MAVQIIGPSGNLLEADGNKNLFKRRGIVHHGSGGGGFLITGGVSTVVAAALAANTMLQALRHGTSATSSIWITRLRVVFGVATVGASGGVPGLIGWQRFTAQTPTGGTARAAVRKDLATGGASQLLDARDSNAALTGTAPTFGDVVGTAMVPLFTQGGAYEWVMDLDEDEFIKLVAGDGLALRTQSAMAATQTWTYAYTIHYLEK